MNRISHRAAVSWIRLVRSFSIWLRLPSIIASLLHRLRSRDVLCSLAECTRSTTDHFEQDSNLHQEHLPLKHATVPLRGVHALKARLADAVLVDANNVI